MNILIIIISLFLGVFAKPVFAQETEVTEIVIVDSVATEGVYIGQTFPVGISIVGAQPNTIFYYKLYGGIDNALSSIQTDPSLNYSSSWDKFPTVITDADGNAYLNTSAYIDYDQSPGFYNLAIRLAFADFYSPAEYKSFPQIIAVLNAITTPTPTIPILTPTPTLTPIPTASPTIHNQVPTLTPTPTNSPYSRQVPTLTPTPTINPKLFGTIATPSATPTDIEFLTSNPEASDSTFIETGSNPSEIKASLPSKKTNLLLIIISGSGISFLITYLIFLKINKK